MAKLNQITIYCIPGKTYEIEIPRTLENFKGYFPLSGSVKIEDSSGSTQLRTIEHNGFVVEDEDIGEILGPLADSMKVGIQYKHKRPGDNTIWFFALTGERLKININGSIDIHDHSSIVTGGPAYGTYYSEPSGGGQ